jgi:hypothetical protein
MRAGNAVVVAKLNQLARWLRGATTIADETAKNGVALDLGGSVYDPTNPVASFLSTSSA